MQIWISRAKIKRKIKYNVDEDRTFRELRGETTDEIHSSISHDAVVRFPAEFRWPYSKSRLRFDLSRAGCIILNFN